MWKFWLLVSAVSFAIEAMTVGFLIFWFGIGALLAMLASFIPNCNIFIQATIFIISSTLLMFLTKPFVKKFPDSNLKTNAFSIIGKHGIVTEDIDTINGKGQIKIGGETWSAKSENNEVITKGNKVEILSIDGVKVLVKALNSSNNN